MNALHPSLPFEEAASIYESIRNLDAVPGALTARYVKRNTQKVFRNQVESIKLFFGGTALIDIGWWNMKLYQDARVAGLPPFVRFRRPQDAKPRKVGKDVLPPLGKTPCKAKPQQVNQEMQLLKRLKKLAGCWTAEDQKWFRYLQEEETGEGRALTPDEQRTWLEMAASRECWSVVYWYSLLAFHTTAGAGEMRGLRLGDCSLAQEVITIPWPSAKNKFRKRTITIDDPKALWALEKLIDRAAELGSVAPQHFLFPAWDPRRNVYVPDLPMSESGLKKKWTELRRLTGLTWFVQAGTRHTGATRAAENGVPIDVIMARMGHARDEMRKHYTQISMAAQRRWMRNIYQPSFERIGPGRVSAAGYDRRWG